MKHFESNIYSTVETADALELLHDLTGIASVNAVMVAGGESELDETDAGCWWGIIALCEGVLAGMEPDAVKAGYENVCDGVSRERKAQRDKVDQAVKDLMTALLGEDE